MVVVVWKGRGQHTRQRQETERDLFGGQAGGRDGIIGGLGHQSAGSHHIHGVRMLALEQLGAIKNLSTGVA